MEDIDYYKGLLDSDLVTGDESLAFVFEFTRQMGGIVTVRGNVNDDIKNATFGLKDQDGKCFLRIIAKDFLIVYPTGSTTEINMEIHAVIELITNGLFELTEH